MRVLTEGDESALPVPRGHAQEPLARARVKAVAHVHDKRHAPLTKKFKAIPLKPNTVLQCAGSAVFEAF